MYLDMESEDTDWLDPEARESLNQLRASGEDIESLAARIALYRDPETQVSNKMVERVLAEMRAQARYRMLTRRLPRSG